MGKQRKSKRQLIRDEKRAKKRGRELEKHQEGETVRAAKRQRLADGNAHDNENENEAAADYIPFDEEGNENDGDNNNDNTLRRGGAGAGAPQPEREFFGVLSDEEQEYFRRADEILELNDFPAPAERDVFLQNVFTEARGKELKLASSQSCSRLMERLILLSGARQKKTLFEAFAGHFITLVTHRFASHCCEKLFVQSAQVVTDELGGVVAEEETVVEGEGEGEEAKPQSSMEDLFLLTLDELEEHLSYLLSDRFGSHTLRVLLVVLSGRPIDEVSTKSLLQSKKKEHITVQGVSAQAEQANSQTRAVPSSFTMAVKKIISDSTASMDATALRLLAKHQTGNPVLQLLLELELSLTPKKEKGRKAGGDEEAQADAAAQDQTLLDRLLPGTPSSLSDSTSPASELINSLLYDPIGSRLLETLITHCPGRIFKPIQANFFAERIHGLLRNEIAMYPAIRVLRRLSREDLGNAVQKCLPEVPGYVERGRFNVLKTLFERCSIRHATEEIDSLLKALCSACGGRKDWRNLVPKLCSLDDTSGKPDQQPTDNGDGDGDRDGDADEDVEGAEDAKEEKRATKAYQQDPKPKTSALVHHGSQLVTTLLSIPGHPSRAVQTSLLTLTAPQLLHMATSSPATANILVKAFSTPVPQTGSIAHFHKMLVGTLIVPHAVELAASRPGHAVLNAVIAAPSRAGEGENSSSSGEGYGIAVPFHAKENVMARLAEHEAELRESWLGRAVWRAWRGDLWQHRRHDWVRWAKEVDPEPARVAAVPKAKGKSEEGKREHRGGGGDGGRGGRFQAGKNKAFMPQTSGIGGGGFKQKREHVAAGAA